MTWPLRMKWHNKSKINSHYLDSVRCRFIYSLKFIWRPTWIPVVLSSSFTDMHRAVKYLSDPMLMSPTNAKQGIPLVSTLLLQVILSMTYLVPYFTDLYASSWWFCSLKCLPIIVLKCNLVFLNTRRIWWTFWRKYMF